MQTLYPKNLPVSTETQTLKPKTLVWDKKYVIENLPPWVYQDNPEPTSVTECEATICRLEHTIEDIELQIKIREFEMETGTGRPQTKHEHDKWVSQALRAKQTHKYLLSAYKYWHIINKKETYSTCNNHSIVTVFAGVISELCELLKEEPANFVEELELLKLKLEKYIHDF